MYDDFSVSARAAGVNGRSGFSEKAAQRVLRALRGIFACFFCIFGDVGFEIGACPSNSLSCGHERRLSGAKPPSVHIVLAAGMILCDAISLLL